MTVNVGLAFVGFVPGVIVTVGGVVSDLNRVYALDYGQWWPIDPAALAQSALGSLG